MNKKWLHNMTPEEQPRLQLAKDCKYSKVLGDSNNWMIVDLEHKNPNDTNNFPYQKEEANLLKLKMLRFCTQYLF